MSGIIKSVAKVFKKVVKAIKKVPIIKAVVIAAAIWFTAGAAMNYFAAPGLGVGNAMSMQATSMWQATTTAFATEGGATVGSIAPESAITETVLAPVGETVAGQTTMAGASGAGNAAITEGVNAGATNIGFNGGVNPGGIVNGAANIPPPPATPGWIEANPMKAMMLGQGVSGAVSSYEAEKQADDDREAEDKRLKDRGLMGVDSEGVYQGGGIVASQMNATDAQKVGAQAVRPIDRKNLPQLQKQQLVRRT